MSKSNDIGRAWEQELEQRLGGRITPGSGNQWHSKLDLHGAAFVLSAKATTSDHYNVTRGDLLEAEQAARGEDRPWIIAVKTSERQTVTLDLDHFLQILETKVTYVEPDKTAALRARVSRPSVLREK